MKEQIENLNWFNLPNELKPILEELSEGTGGGGEVTTDNITDATEVGKNILKASNANEVRSLIGAGTSNLQIGTTSTTAKAGNWTPPNVTTSANGLMLSTDKTKLDAIATEATKNDTDANLKNRANHTGTQPFTTLSGTATISQLPTGTTATTVALGNHSHAFSAITGTLAESQVPSLPTSKITSGTFDIARIPTGTAASTVSLGNHTHGEASTTVSGFMSSADKTKLNGIASNATANATDASLRDRSTHTGTQAFTTISGTATAAQIPSLDAAKITTGTFPIARVNTALTGYAIGTAEAVSATDTLLQAIAKLEARILALETA